MYYVANNPSRKAVLAGVGAASGILIVRNPEKADVNSQILVNIVFSISGSTSARPISLEDLTSVDSFIVIKSNHNYYL